MEKELEFNGKTYISSKRAAEITGYTHDYIGQLCRSGKVEGQLVGRTRFVDKDSLLAHVRRYSGAEKAASSAAFSSTDDQVPQMSAGEDKNTLEEKDISSRRDADIFSHESLRTPAFTSAAIPPAIASEIPVDDTDIRKIPITKKHRSIPSAPTARRTQASLRHAPAVAAVVPSHAAPMLALPEPIRRTLLFVAIFTIVSGGYAQLWRGDVFESASLSPKENATAIEDRNNSIASYTATLSSGFVPDTSLEAAAGASAPSFSLWSSVKESASGLAAGVYRAARDSYSFGKQKMLALFTKEEKTIIVNDPPRQESPSAQDGMVVLPSSGDGVMDKEERERVKEYFSDEVVVVPDETGGSGIIKPVFKSGKDDEYSFVLVPITK